MMRIAKKRYEATDEQRWFSPPPCRIDELAPPSKRIHDDPQPRDEIRLPIGRI